MKKEKTTSAIEYDLTMTAARKLLHMAKNTLKSYIEEGDIPKKAFSATLRKLSSKELAKALGVPDLTELIATQKAQEILEIASPLKESICRSRGIPCYRFKKRGKPRRSSHILFVASEVKIAKRFFLFQNSLMGREFQAQHRLLSLLKNALFGEIKNHTSEDFKMIMEYLKGDSYDRISSLRRLSSDQVRARLYPFVKWFPLLLKDSLKYFEFLGAGELLLPSELYRRYVSLEHELSQFKKENEALKLQIVLPVGTFQKVIDNGYEPQLPIEKLPLRHSEIRALRENGIPNLGTLLTYNRVTLRDKKGFGPVRVVHIAEMLAEQFHLNF